MKAGTAQKVVLNLISTRHHAAAWPGLSRHDGEHADDQCQAEAPRRGHGGANRAAAIRRSGRTLASSRPREISRWQPSGVGLDRVEAEGILKNCDGNLRRVFADLTKDRRSERAEPKEAAARKQGGAVEP